MVDLLGLAHWLICWDMPMPDTSCGACGRLVRQYDCACSQTKPGFGTSNATYGTNFMDHQCIVVCDKTGACYPGSVIAMTADLLRRVKASYGAAGGDW